MLVSQGVIQNLKPYTTAELIEPQTVQVTGTDGKTSRRKPSPQQVIAQGPVASQEAIKNVGHQRRRIFSTPTARIRLRIPLRFRIFLQMVLIFAISAGLTYTLGRMTGSQRHGWAVWAAMAFLFLLRRDGRLLGRGRGNPLLAGVDQQRQRAAIRRQHGRKGSAIRHRRTPLCSRP